MVKLTPDLIEQSYQFTNPVRDRELDLRGYKIPIIENLGATLDQFDTIDLSDNDIRKLDGFPLLKRLRSVILNNNRITRIGDKLEELLPSLETLVLTNNNVQELGDLDSLGSFNNLTYLSLLRNPVSAKKYYRLYAIYKIPSLRVLDFQKIKQREREAAAKMFKGRKGKALAAEMSGNASKVQTFVPGAAPTMQAAQTVTPTPQRPKQDVEAIKRAIANARTLEEVERLNKLLQSGQVPGLMAPSNGHEAMEAE